MIFPETQYSQAQAEHELIYDTKKRNHCVIKKIRNDEIYHLD